MLNNLQPKAQGRAHNRSTMMTNYSLLTDDVFDGILENQVASLSAAQLLAIPGIYEILREELNNDVLDSWAEDNPSLAYPDSDDE